MNFFELIQQDALLQGICSDKCESAECDSDKCDDQCFEACQASEEYDYASWVDKIADQAIRHHTSVDEDIEGGFDF